MRDSSHDHVALLGVGDPPPFEVVGTDRSSGLLLVCDHAGNAFPSALGGLGLPVEATVRHIAWDIGARQLTLALAEQMHCRAVLGRYSRLVTDLNRSPTHPTVMTTDGDGHRIPGNETISPAQRQARLREIHAPYHERLTADISALEQRGPVALVAIHSFTPVLAGKARPWVAGVLWDRDPRLAGPLLQRLRAGNFGPIGDNQPYSGRAPADYTMHRHGDDRGHPHVSLEIRQDELLTPMGIHRWAVRLADLLRPVLSTQGVAQ